MADLKFLGVGFMKTGLTSLHDAMAAMGFATQHRRFRIWKAFRKRDYDTVLANYETADVFVDWPHPYMYKPFLERYGERARFILTVRDPEEWYASLLRHNRLAHPVTHSQKYTLGRYYPHGFKDEHIRVYTEHNETVKRWLEEQGAADKLLVLRTGAPGSLERLKAFAGVDSDLDDYPRSNVSARRKHRDIADDLRRAYNRLVQPAYAKLAPRLRPEPGARLAPVNSDAAGGSHR